LDPSQQRTLLAALTFHESELPVIGSVQDASNWLVLTTERLVWSRADELQKVTVDAISSTAPDKSQLRPKPEMRQLQVVTIEGGKYSIELEPGRPLFGTWNVLNNAGTRNRNAIKRIKATQGE
jgi:hypothetical protein